MPEDFRVEEPQDERSRWWVYQDDDEEPLRAYLACAGLAFPGLLHGSYTTGYATLLFGEFGDAHVGNMKAYVVVDWYESDSAQELGRRVAEWARRLKKANSSESPWESLAVSCPVEPLEAWDALIDQHPTMQRRFWRDEWTQREVCLPKLKDRYGLPGLKLGLYEYEGELETARLSIARAVCELDECCRHLAAQAISGGTETGTVDRGPTAYG